jgi:hypothetical protein
MYLSLTCIKTILYENINDFHIKIHKFFFIMIDSTNLVGVLKHLSIVLLLSCFSWKTCRLRDRCLTALLQLQLPMTNKKVFLLFGRRTQRPKTKALSFKSRRHIISSNTKPVFFITDFSYHRWVCACLSLF